MAVIPKYVSNPDATPSISNARMDPNAASAPIRAEAQAVGGLFDTLQGELQGWHKALYQKQAEQEAAAQKNAKVNDSLYNAQASAKLALGAHDLQSKVLQQSDGTTNHANLVDSEFQKLVDSVISNAPSEASKTDLLKRAIKMRTDLYTTTADKSVKVNNQINMDRIEGTLNQYEAFASQNPHSINEIRNQAADIFKSMEDLGIPGRYQAQIQQKFYNNLDYQAAASLAEHDPQQILDRLKAGDFNHLGVGSVQKLQKVADSSFKAVVSQAQESILDLEKSVMKGNPLPADTEARLRLASSVGLTDSVADITRLNDVSKTLQGASLTQLIATKNEMLALKARGQLDLAPDKADKLIKFVETRQNELQNDPFQFSLNQGDFKPFSPITDFSALTPDEANQRKYRAMQINETYGVKSAAITQGELDVALSQIDGAPIEKKVKVLANLNQLGPETVGQAVLKADKKKDYGLAQAIRLSAVDSETAGLILKGRDILKTTSAKVDKAEESDAKQELSKFAADPDTIQGALNAARAYKAATGATDLVEVIKKANNLVDVGRNGLFSGKYSTVAPAANMSSDDFTGFVDNSLTDSKTWKQFGTGIPTQTTSGKSLPMNRIQPSDYDYVFNKDGRYGVKYEGEDVLDAQGAPIIIDLVTLHNRVR